jgi:hypothetical protein
MNFTTTLFLTLFSTQQATAPEEPAEQKHNANAHHQSVQPHQDTKKPENRHLRAYEK